MEKTFNSYLEFENLMKKIGKSTTLYERKNISDYTYKLFLSNGDVIHIEFIEDSIPHLLGINVDFIRSTSSFKQNSAYDILLEIIDRQNTIYRATEEGRMNKNQIFSEHIDKKLDNFPNICGINLHNFLNIEFIVKYKKHIAFESGENGYDGDYYIGYRLSPTNIAVLGVKKYRNCYIPMTNLNLDLEDEEDQKTLKKLLNNQVITGIKTLIVQDNYDYNNNRKYYYNNEQLYNKYKCLKDYADEYNCICDTHSDNVYQMKKTLNICENNNTWDVLDELTKAINERKILDIPPLEEEYGSIRPTVLEVISAHNDSLVNSDKNKSNSEEENNEYSYFDIITKYKKLKTELHEKQELIEKLTSQNKKALEAIETLEQENNELLENENAIRKILTRKENK